MKLYGVFVDKKFGMETSKKRAIAAAKQWGGEVRAMPHPGETFVWDGPTFYVCSDQIADFRK